MACQRRVLCSCSVWWNLALACVSCCPQRCTCCSLILPAPVPPAGEVAPQEEALPFALEGLEAALKLDLQLTYLLNVHGVDYYAGGQRAGRGRARACPVSQVLSHMLHGMCGGVWWGGGSAGAVQVRFSR
jgi:hypothetical protein